MNWFARNYFERAVSPSRWLWFRRLYLSALVLQLLYDFRYYLAAIQQKPHYNPIPILRLLATARPEAPVFEVLLYALIGLLILAVLGFFARWSLPVCVPLCFWILGVQAGLDKAAGSDYVFHSKNLVIFILLLFAVAPAGTRKIWPLTLVRLSLALVYFGSAFSKLKTAGWHWMDGYTLRGFLYEHAYLLELPQTLWLANRHGLCIILSVAIVAFEFFFPFFVLHRKISLFFAAGGIFLHLSIIYFMKINFLPYHGFAYLIFLVGGFDQGTVFSKSAK